MKTRLSIIMAIILFSVFPGNSLMREPHVRVLVLGFTSPHMDEIERRVMREEVIRDLARRKIAYVPVMQTEKILRSHPDLEPGSVSQDALGKLFFRSSITHVLEGTVVSFSSGKGALGHKGKSYRCSLKIYSRKKGKTGSLEIVQKGKNDRHQFVRELSRRVVAALVERGILVL